MDGKKTEDSRWPGRGALVDRWLTAAFAAALTALTLLPVIVSPAPLEGQEPDRLRVFLDCQTRGCPEREFRTEISFVDWIREPTAADLHVILTRQSAGAGTEWVFDVLGRNEFSEETFSFATTVPATATQNERLDALTRTMKAALASYVARRGYGDQLEIVARTGAGDGAGRLDPGSDRWRLWVFSIGARGGIEGEEREKERDVYAYMSANRTTHDWKVNFRLDGSFNEREVELSDGVFEYRRDSWEMDGLIVRSITPHLSAGTELEVNRSSRLNREVGGRAALALEWNRYPYEEANRRQLLVHYQLGYSHIRYEELTIFDKMHENLLDHRLAAVWQTRQAWGDGSLGAHYTGYLHDWSKYRLALGGELNIRLLRGLELDVDGSYDLIRDQLYLPAAELDDEDILVQRRQLATGYEYQVRVGLSYRFGSIFNNVVNNRFPRIIRSF